MRAMRMELTVVQYAAGGERCVRVVVWERQDHLGTDVYQIQEVGEWGRWRDAAGEPAWPIRHVHAWIRDHGGTPSAGIGPTKLARAVAELETELETCCCGEPCLHERSVTRSYNYYARERRTWDR